MDKAFPPEPTTPLEKLEVWVKENRFHWPGDTAVDYGELLKKIAELRKEG